MSTVNKELTNRAAIMPFEDTPYVVTESEYQYFREHGYVVLHNVLTLSEVEELKNCIDELLDGSRQVENPDDWLIGSASNEAANDPGRLTLQVMPFKFPITEETVRNSGNHPKIKSIASQLVSIAQVELFQLQALVKRPGEVNPTPWHQDNHY